MAMRDGPAAGLVLVDAILNRGVSATTTWRTPLAQVVGGSEEPRTREAPEAGLPWPAGARAPFSNGG